jgi:hypothetical protein
MKYSTGPQFHANVMEGIRLKGEQVTPLVRGRSATDRAVV